jgi:hypothetical protein
MADDFDAFLAARLAPPDRLPDRRFVAGVQARIAVEQRFERQRRAVLANLAAQLIALAAVGAAVWWLSSAAPVANWTGEFPAEALAILLAAFALMVVLFSRQPPEANLGTAP